MQLNLEGLAAPIVLRPAVALSDEELMRFSEENKPYKIERTREGELTVITPVGYIGGTHEIEGSAALLNWSKMDGRGSAVGPNAGFHLPDDSCLAPDAAWTSFARLNELTAEQQAGFLPLCPDFVVEVRSRTDSRRLLEAKMQLWMDNGAKLAWLVDPVDGNVTIYRPGREAETLERPDVVVAGEPVEGFQLACARLWAAR